MSQFVIKFAKGPGAQRDQVRTAHPAARHKARPVLSRPHRNTISKQTGPVKSNNTQKVIYTTALPWLNNKKICYKNSHTYIICKKKRRKNLIESNINGAC